MKVREQLTGQEIFRHLLPPQVDRLSKLAKAVKYKKGEVIYEPGDRCTHVFIVVKGRVTLCLKEQSSFGIVVDECGEGSLFGISVLLGIDRYGLSAECTKNCEILKIEFRELKRIMEEDPRTASAMQAQVARIFYDRYIDTIKRLQAIVTDIRFKPKDE